MLFVGLVAPHFPLQVPQDFLNLYPLEAMPAPRLHPNDGFLRHPWLEAFHACFPVDESLDEAGRKLATACYYGLCSFMDHQVGRILKTLEESGLAAHTRVLYSSDHGDNLGTRGLWGKCTLYEESAGIPLIFAGTDIPTDHVCRTNASLIDFYPTILEALGVPLPEEAHDLPGKSLFETAHQPDDRQHLVFSEYHALGAASGAFMIRKGNYKYNHYVGFSPELFDLIHDPGETKNLANDPAFASICKDYEGFLREIVQPEEADCQAKADQAELVRRYGGVEKALALGPAGATPAPEQ